MLRKSLIKLLMSLQAHETLKKSTAHWSYHTKSKKVVMYTNKMLHVGEF